MLCKAHYLAFEKPYFCEVKGGVFLNKKTPFFFWKKYLFTFSLNCFLCVVYLFL